MRGHIAGPAPAKLKVIVLEICRPREGECRIVQVSASMRSFPSILCRRCTCVFPSEERPAFPWVAKKKLIEQVINTAIAVRMSHARAGHPTADELPLTPMQKENLTFG